VRRSRLTISALGLFLVFASLVWWRHGARRDPQAPGPAAIRSTRSSPAQRRRAGGLDVTFVVAGDLHLGWGAVEASTADSDHHPAPIDDVHRRMIEDLNHIAGKPYPADLGGVVARPLGLLVAGDLTEHGSESDWNKFLSFYGLDGRDGQLHLPVFEGIGNHDQAPGDFVPRQVVARHGSDPYAWDWGDLHVVCLGIAPDARGLAWLEQDLARVGAELPLVLYLHYALAGPYGDTWFSREGYRDRFRDLLRGYNVVAIFHGHFHGSGAYRWEGRDVYSTGSPKDTWRSFSVVHVTDTRLSLSSWNYDLHAWWWWHDKGINGAARDARTEVSVPAGFEPLPLVEQTPG
jgi:hypothetical protein